MSQQINLYNPSFEKQTTLFSATAIAQSMGLIFLGAVALAAFAYQRTDKLEEEEKVVSARLKQRELHHDMMLLQFQPRPRDAAIERELASAEAELKSLRTVSGMVTRGDMGNTKGYADYFRAFARQDVQGLWLTGATIVGAGKEIEVKGRTMQSELVPIFIGRLTQEASLKGKSFDMLDIGQVTQTVQRQTKDGQTVESTEVAPFLEFSLQAVILPEPPPAPAAQGAAPAVAPAAAAPATVAQAPAATGVAK